MDKIYIKNETGRPHDTYVTTSDGTDITKGLKRLNLSIDVDKCIATLEYILPAADIKANPLLSLESIRVFAKHYGYKLEEE